MLLLVVDGADALLKGEERLVDFGSVEPRLLVLVYRVRSALAASQIDEAHLSEGLLVRHMLQLQLQNCVGPGTVGVGPSDAAGARLESTANDFHDLIYIRDGNF